MVERRILFVRDEKVRIDSDIADLYEVPTKRLNRAVSRFPGLPCFGPSQKGERDDPRAPQS